jgi:hypothetical protein
MTSNRLIGTAAIASALALGASLEYFLDPSAGAARRHTVRDRVLSTLRRGERRAFRRARRAESRTVGMATRTLNARRAHGAGRRPEPYGPASARVAQRGLTLADATERSTAPARLVTGASGLLRRLVARLEVADADHSGQAGR